MHALIFLPNWIGDVAMATPTLRALRGLWGEDATITAVARPYVAEVLSGTSWIDNLVLHDRRGKEWRTGSWSLVRQLRQRRADVAAVLTNSLSSALLCWLGGARRRVGYARDLRGWLLTDRLKAPRDSGGYTPISALDYYLNIASALGCPPADKRMELMTTAAEEQAAEQLWKRLGIARGDRAVMVNTGGAFGGAKHWPAGYTARLCRRLAERGLRVVVNCGPKERDFARAIAREADAAGVTSFADEDVGIGALKAALRRCSLMVSTDSGPRHLAVALGVPTVSLFGSMDPAWSRTYAAHETVLQRKVPCGPCHERECPQTHHRCMRELSVDQVLEAATGWLDRTSAA